MSEKVMVDYDEKFDVLKITIDGAKDSLGVDFPGGVVFRGIEDGMVTGVMLWNASKVISRKVTPGAQRSVDACGGVGVPNGAAGRKACVYTDGSCLGNPGAGGWASIVEVDGVATEFSGGESFTTNNRMELMAVISALESLSEPVEVIVYADSQYVINGIEKGWARKWKANGWVKSDRTPALNSELWDRLLTQCDKHVVKFKWVKGHAGDARNERCDKLAKAEAVKAQRK